MKIATKLIIFFLVSMFITFYVSISQIVTLHNLDIQTYISIFIGLILSFTLGIFLSQVVTLHNLDMQTYISIFIDLILSLTLVVFLLRHISILIKNATIRCKIISDKDLTLVISEVDKILFNSI